jgi:hypothetical protein
MIRPFRRRLFYVLLLCAGGCGPRPDPARLDAIAEQYVKTVLALGRHDAGEVDAYYGPATWRAEADSAAPVPLPQLASRAESLATVAGKVAIGKADEMVRLRQRFLIRQLRAVAARARLMSGDTLTFDDESRALYDVVAPPLADSTLDRTLAELDRLIPGEGSLTDRWIRYQEQFRIPADRVDTVFRAALAECRGRTFRHLVLPDSESFAIEYVKGVSWAGYNWYQGGLRSLIQVNLDQPIYIERAVDLAAHEGYPGHHVYNLMLEHELVRKRGWVEYTVYPLFAPQSLMAEGTAVVGPDVAFGPGEKVAFEQRVLFPLAGLDTSRARPYREILRLTERLGGAQSEAARRYLDRRMSRDSTIAWVMRYRLYSRDRAERSVKFMEKYRSYVVNYSVGADLVRGWLNRQAGDDPEARWTAFRRLLASPRLPADLQDDTD